MKPCGGMETDLILPLPFQAPLGLIPYFPPYGWVFKI